MNRKAVVLFAAVVFMISLSRSHLMADSAPDGLRWWSHVTVLADDKLEGCNTCSEGHRKAAEHVTREFARAGLEPAATHGFVQNVVALLPGTDPTLKDEYVVFSAHYDRLGVGKPIHGDSIDNGAMDNASGAAAQLDVAAILKETGAKLRRSVLYLAVTGEKKGLLGSRFFAHIPPGDPKRNGSSRNGSRSATMRRPMIWPSPSITKPPARSTRWSPSCSNESPTATSDRAGRTRRSSSNSRNNLNIETPDSSNSLPTG